MADFPEVDAEVLTQDVKADPRYDIFSALARFLDPHLVFPVLTYLEGLKIYDPLQIKQAKLELARKTNMADYAIQVYQDIHGAEAPIPNELDAATARVGQEWRDHMAAAGPLLELMFGDHADADSAMPTPALEDMINVHTFTMEDLASNHNINSDVVDALYDCAKFRYDCGEYNIAADYLNYYCLLVPRGSDASFKALWGRLAADTLSMRFEKADHDWELLRDHISKASLSELDVLQQRSWLLHWSLFVFSNKPDKEEGKEMLVEFFMQDQNLNAIQLNCPWLLRYITASVLTNRKRQSYIRPLLKVISQESAGNATHRDPIIEFLEALLVSFDFDGAQAKLAECESVIATDFFLAYLTTPKEFMKHAREFIFETYCRIHQKIDLGMLAAKLHMTESDAEKWVVDLIRTASQDAKIDSTGRQVIMTVQHPSIYQQVIEKTRDLSTRTRMLAENVEIAISENGNAQPSSGGGSMGSSNASASFAAAAGDRRRR